MNIIVKKGLRVTGIVILVMGVLGLIMQLVDDLYGYPAHYSGAVILIVFGISLYWAAGPKEKKEAEKPSTESEIANDKVVGVVGGILWLLCLPFMAVSVLMAIVPGIILGTILYLFGVSEKSASKVFICIVAVCFLFIILLLISYYSPSTIITWLITPQ